MSHVKCVIASPHFLTFVCCLNVSIRTCEPFRLILLSSVDQLCIATVCITRSCSHSTHCSVHSACISFQCSSASSSTCNTSKSSYVFPQLPSTTATTISVTTCSTFHPCHCCCCCHYTAVLPSSTVISV